MFRILNCLFLYAALLFSSLGFSAGKIELKGALKSELNSVLQATNEMHDAFFDQDEPQIAAKVKNLIFKIDKANKRSTLAAGQRTHLAKMLGAAKAELEFTQIQSGEKRQDHLKNAFKQLVQLVKVYELDSYRIFFCSKDKATWIQKAWKPKNPINPKKHPDCGKLVR